MGLLAPLFLAGLLAVAVPILVHLVHRERKEPLGFPSLMFLRRVPFRSARRQRIRYWLLFLLRSAAVLLVALAFARPWVKRATIDGGGARGGKDVVLLIDRSYSMSTKGQWQRTLDAARSVIKQSGVRDRVAVIGFGEQAELLARLDDPRRRAEAAIQSIKPSADVTRFGPAFKLAGSQLVRSRGPAEIVVITDRQRSGWRNVGQVDVPPNTIVRVLDVRGSRGNNVAVTDVRLTPLLFAGRQRMLPTARLVNRGSQHVTVPVVLRIDERVQQQRRVNVSAGSTTEVRFDAVYAANAVGDIRIDMDDDLEIDDVAYFTTERGGAGIVRVISGNSDASFYFESAVAAGGEAAFELHRTNGRITPADLSRTDVLVFMEAALPTGRLATEIEEYVTQGGGLIVIAGGQRAEHALLPVGNAGPVEGEVAIVSIEDQHPLFDAFRLAGAAPFAGARISRYLRSEVLPEATVLARFDDGSPALVERRIGRGRVLYWASGFGRASGDLVLQPGFVPLVQQMLKYAAANAQVQRTFVVGNVIDVNTFAPTERDAVVLTPGRERLRLGASTGARTLRVAEPGIYQVRGTGPGATTQLLAANVDVNESDVAALPAETFNDAISPRTRQPLSAAAVPASDREQQQGLWWYLLMAAFLCLAVETWLANRISTAWRT